MKHIFKELTVQLIVTTILFFSDMIAKSISKPK